jgi:hypothetical protein
MSQQERVAGENRQRETRRIENFKVKNKAYDSNGFPQQNAEHRSVHKTERI